MKHSRLYLGFMKMRQRQYAKPQIKRLKTDILSYSEKHSEYRFLIKKHFNSKWNGMNLMELCSSLNTYERNKSGMYSIIRINSDGKHILSMHGKQVLKRKLAKKYKNHE